MAAPSGVAAADSGLGAPDGDGLVGNALDGPAQYSQRHEEKKAPWNTDN